MLPEFEALPMRDQRIHQYEYNEHQQDQFFQKASHQYFALFQGYDYQHLHFDENFGHHEDPQLEPLQDAEKSSKRLEKTIIILQVF